MKSRIKYHIAKQAIIYNIKTAMILLIGIGAPVITVLIHWVVLGYK